MTNNKQQTAVEQFAIALYENGFLTGNGDEIQELLEKAKAIDKGQRQHAFEQSRLNNRFVGFKYKSFEQYYKKTYGGGEQ
jgi:chemotaxis methyl-accepting protein methylase